MVDATPPSAKNNASDQATTDPRHSPDGNGGFVNLFSTSFMGSSTGDAGYPLQDFESSEGGGHAKLKPLRISVGQISKHPRWRQYHHGRACHGAEKCQSENSYVTACENYQPRTDVKCHFKT